MPYGDIARTLSMLNIVIAAATVVAHLYLANKRRWPKLPSVHEPVEQFIELLQNYRDRDRVYTRRIVIVTVVGGALMAITSLVAIIATDRAMGLDPDIPSTLQAANLIYFIVGILMVAMVVARRAIDSRLDIGAPPPDRLDDEKTPPITKGDLP